MTKRLLIFFSMKKLTRVKKKEEEKKDNETLGIDNDDLTHCICYQQNSLAECLKFTQILFYAYLTDPSI